jgi:hypothetical protein
VIIVGDRDISNIPLQQILDLPLDLDSRPASAPAAEQNPGTIVSLPAVRGRLVDASTGARFDLDRVIGRITINGNTVSYTINNTGEFEIPSLLPGRYDLNLWIFEGNSYSRVLEVGDANMTLEWPVSVPN